MFGPQSRFLVSKRLSIERLLLESTHPESHITFGPYSVPTTQNTEDSVKASAPNNPVHCTAGLYSARLTATLHLSIQPPIMWPFSSSSAPSAPKPVMAPATEQQVQLLPATGQALPTAQSQYTTPPPAQSHTKPTEAPQDPDFYAAHPHLAPPSFSTPSPTSDTPAAQQEEFDPTLPRSMSCRAAFDSAFYCSSLGGHFNDLYRYGQLRSCSDHWNDFWFCMRTKNSYSGPEVKERLIQERYAEKEKALKTKPNCEDVWTRRGPGEEVKNPFALAGKE